MAKIIAPNKQYTGTSAGVSFVHGEGETDNPHLIEWFESKGYTIDNSAEIELRKKIQEEAERLVEEEKAAAELKAKEEADAEAKAKKDAEKAEKAKAKK